MTGTKKREQISEEIGIDPPLIIIIIIIIIVIIIIVIIIAIIYIIMGICMFACMYVYVYVCTTPPRVLIQGLPNLVRVHLVGHWE